MSDEMPYIVGFPYEQYGTTLQSTPEGKGYLTSLGQGAPKPSILNPSLSSPAPQLSRGKRGLPSERLAAEMDMPKETAPQPQGGVPNKRPKPNKMSDSEMAARAAEMLKKIEADKQAMYRNAPTVNPSPQPADPYQPPPQQEAPTENRQQFTGMFSGMEDKPEDGFGY